MSVRFDSNKMKILKTDNFTIKDVGYRMFVITLTEKNGKESCFKVHTIDEGMGSYFFEYKESHVCFEWFI